MTEGLPLYLKDAELAKIIGLDPDRYAAVFLAWERLGFPPKDAQLGKRYFPAVRLWLDRRNGVAPKSAHTFKPDGEEHFDEIRRRA